ncbi:ferric-rhodotorulic acid/ferric-coprogen receptor FhuE [Xanthomonas sp. 3058]|uniref:ferric-rhodotorulic acid/ferric-coprogen receptor FhuE n=1 Tax=Xanthomonas sp. 3058 TaxID=3035314 RepID=UPI0021A3D2FE|nr:ferric-rhodotorulic acid/ferric-coprogen receptor FhuE [Xanthomonas sp. 3058]
MGARRHVLPRALLAALCTMAAGQVLAEAPVAAADAEVTTLDRLNVQAEQANGYTVEKTTAGTRMDLSLREIPQSVSVITRDRLDDQNLQTITDVLANVTGISGTFADSERPSFFARGFRIDNYQFDGIPTTLVPAWTYGDGGLDLAIYDRIEVVRGATGLLTGAGNPSASINLVRKHADSHKLTGSVSTMAGSWGNTRSVVDVTVPLNASGSVRVRAVGSYQDKESFMDRYGFTNKVGYAVLDADVGENTLLSIGYDYQDKRVSDPTWGGFPMLWSDGTRTRWDRSLNFAPEYTRWNTASKRAFASLNHRFDNDWKLTAVLNQGKADSDSKLFYLYGLPSRVDGVGVFGGAGWYILQRETRAADVYAEGPFQLFGRQHQLVTGLSVNRQENSYTGTFVDAIALPDFSTWDGVTPEPAWPGLASMGGEIVRQNAGYAAARLSLADPLTLILGARHTRWESEGAGVDREHNVTTPYAGLVYDIDKTWSTYLSYSDIFNPQSLKSRDGTFLDPVEGRNYEAGVKAAWFDGGLNASLAIFRIEQDNLAQAVPGVVLPGTGEQVYVGARGTVSEGFDFEVSGEITAGWNATFGGSHYTARDADDASINTELPRSTLKLFTSYTPQGSWNALTVGGGVNWQNRTYTDVLAPFGATRVEQGGYTLVSLFARYRIAPQFSVQVNLENLLDERYYGQISGGGAWGNPRNGALTFNYTF